MAGIDLKGFKVLNLKGLDNLISDANRKTFRLTEELCFFPIESLVSGKFQPRVDFKSSTLNELAASIKANGILQPLIIRKLDQEKYEIVAGERRWRASKIAGLTEVPAVLRDIPDETALAFALIENIQREDLNPIDQAFAFSKLKEQFLMTHEEISQKVGKSRSTITNSLRLLTLDIEVKNLLTDGKLEVGHAKALLSLSFEQQLSTAKQIIEQNLTVREAESVVQKIKNQLPNSRNIDLNNRTKHLSEMMAGKLSSPVKLRLQENGTCKIEILVKSLEEVEWFAEHLKLEQ